MKDVAAMLSGMRIHGLFPDEEPARSVANSEA